MPRPKTIKPPDIAVVVDLGSYGTKVLVRSLNGETQCFLFPPHQISLSPQQVEALEYQPKLPADTQIWIKSPQGCSAVGKLAKVRFGAQLGLSLLKVDSAIAKVLGVLWVLQQELGLSAKFKVALSVLLPPGEYADRARFRADLIAALKMYTTPSGQITANLTHLLCLPEGGGVVLSRRQHDPQFNQKKVVVSIIGGRNASVLVYEEGVYAAASTSNLGFIDLVRGVLQRTSGMDAEVLIPLIAKAGSKPMPFHFVKASRRSQDSDRQQELVELAQAVSEARQETFTKLVAWYREVLPANWDEIIFCGGTADYYKDDLSAKYSKPTSGQTVWFHGGIKLPAKLNDYGLGVRLYDPYAAFEQLVVAVMPESVEVEHG
ncbi:MAG: ParM/StbA family protein [Leptolyngbya sp. Prado105]|nr:ParM/StbA family protein [Leptolyngbya sp. Prado105]